MIARTRFSIALLVALLASCMESTRPSPDALTIIDHVTVLDGRGGPALEDSRVIIRDGIIESVSASKGETPAGAQVFNGRRRFLLPGFIDMHAHLLFPRCPQPGQAPWFDRKLSERALAAQLTAGVTTVRSPSNPTQEGLALRDDLNAERVVGPRAVAAAELINDARASDSALRQAVRDALPYRPDFIKVYARLKPAQLAVLVDEAKQNRLTVMGHLQQSSWAEGVAAGVRHLAHAVDWSPLSLPPESRAAYLEAARTRSGFLARIDWLEAFDPFAAAHQALIDSLVRNRVSVDVTLMAYDGKFSTPDETEFRKNRALDEFPELRDDWTRCADATANWTNDDHRRWAKARPKLGQWVKRMSDAGVLLVTGTDLTNEWIAPGNGLHQEFGLLRKAGVSPDRILKMTGQNAAEALGRDDIGVIESGRRADLVLLNADPRRDIANTRAIHWVMQGGRILSGSAR